MSRPDRPIAGPAREPPRPRLRKPLGMLGLIAALGLYALAVAAFADEIARLPALAEAAVYLVLGVAWTIPARPLLAWIETGRLFPRR